MSAEKISQSTLERRWVRPTAEVTGMWAGWTGDGVKTVLPAEAHATIVARLVPHQTPVRAYDALAAGRGVIERVVVE